MSQLNDPLRRTNAVWLGRLFSPERLLVLVVLTLGLAIGFLIPSITQGLTFLGHRIPQLDMSYDYLAGALLAAFIAASIPFWPVSKVDQKILLRLWLIRCAVTLGFMLVYEYQYGLDAYGYFTSSAASSFDWSSVKVGDGTTNIQAIAWLFNHALPLQNSYHSLKVCFSLTGFLAIYIVYRGCVLHLGREEGRLLYVLGLFPSILFWSSILGKDPVNLLGIALYVYGVISFLKHRKLSSLVIVAGGISIAAFIRIWSALILVAPLATVAIKGVRSTGSRILFIIFFLAGFSFVFQSFSTNFNVESAESVTSTTHSASHAWSTGGSGQKAPEFKSLGQMIAFAPIGIFTALFRPLPGEVLNIFGTLAGFENLMLLYLLVRALRRFGVSAFKEPVVFWGTSFVLIWSFIYGFISYQNLGSGARFKLQILPVLLTLILYLSNKEQAPRVRNSRVR